MVLPICIIHCVYILLYRDASTFESTCSKTGLPDDATVGIIIGSNK